MSMTRVKYTNDETAPILKTSKSQAFIYESPEKKTNVGAIIVSKIAAYTINKPYPNASPHGTLVIAAIHRVIREQYAC